MTARDRTPICADIPDQKKLRPGFLPHPL